tara:strand:- start:15654 stop:16469 length:816 start_codon:yes stop_codon:yes gene_type:complete
VAQSIDFATFLGGNSAYADSNQQATGTSNPDVVKIVDKNGQVFEIPADIDLGPLGPLGVGTGGGLNFASGLQSRAQDIDLATFLGGGQSTQQQEPQMVDTDNLPDWITPPDPDKVYPTVVSFVTNPHTGETVGVPSPGYTYNESYTPPQGTGTTPPATSGNVVGDARGGMRGEGPRNTGGAPYRGIDFATFLGNTDTAPAPPPVSREIVVPSAMPPNPQGFSNPYVPTPPAGPETTFMNLLGSIPNAPPPPNPYVSTAQGIASLAKPDGSI